MVKVWSNIDCQGQTSIINLPNPANSTDASNKQYVDSKVTSAIPIEYIDVYTLSDLTSYINGVGEIDFGLFPLDAQGRPKGLRFMQSIQLLPLRLKPGQTCYLDSAYQNERVQLIFVGDNAFIRGSGIFGFNTNWLTLVAANNNPNQSLFDISNGANPVNWSQKIFLYNTILSGWKNLGTLEGTNQVYINSLACFDWGTGFLFKNIGLLSCQAVTFGLGKNTNGVAMTLDSIVDRPAIQFMNFLLGTTEHALDIKSTSTISKAIIKNIVIDKPLQLFASGSKIQTDPVIDLTGVPGASDSDYRYTGVDFPGAPGYRVTSFAASNTWTKANISLTTQIAERFILTSANRITYIGLETIALDAQVLCTLEPDGGANPDARIAVFKNGVTVNNQGVTTRTGTKTTGICVTSIQVSTNDYLEIFLINESTTLGLRTSNVTLKIRH